MMNPRWERLQELLSAVRPQAEVLATALDKAWRCYPGALNSPEGERVADELQHWRRRTQIAAEATVREMEMTISRTPRTLNEQYW